MSVNLLQSARLLLIGLRMKFTCTSLAGPGKKIWLPTDYCYSTNISMRQKLERIISPHSNLLSSYKFFLTVNVLMCDIINKRSNFRLLDTVNILFYF